MPEDLLKDGLSQYALENISASYVEDALKYLTELERWNAVHNLTAITDAYESVIRHILDSLSIKNLLKITPTLDMGSGAGLPGIPLALTQRDWPWYLVDSSSKRVQFLEYVCRKLQLTQVKPLWQRLEKGAPEIQVSQVVCRALGSITQCLEWARPWLTDEAQIILMRGHVQSEELQNLGKGFTLSHVESLEVPFLQETRHAVVIQFNRNS